MNKIGQEDKMKDMTRRRFLEKSALGILGLFAFRPIFSGGRPRSRLTFNEEKDGYGPLIRDPEKIIDLPEGFSYKLISLAGRKMNDGFSVPFFFDGMATLSGPDGLTIIMRNHEVGRGLPAVAGAFGNKNQLMKRLEDGLIYDRGIGGTTCLGAVTTIVYDAKSQKVRSQFLSLAGTLTNCGGEATPWNTWLSCEEEFQSAGREYARDHGYVFEVMASIEPRITKPLALKAMGRFIHEGVAIEPHKSIIYQTEDQKDSLLYRFIPHRPEHLSEGGRLQCLAIIDKPGFDTRNWDKQRVLSGEKLPVHWIDLDEVDSDRDDLRYRGYKQGAAIFARGEGICYHKGIVYFDCTIGGRTGTGQIWRYFLSPYEGNSREKESPGKLELFIEPNDKMIMENPDQLTIAPWGDLLICEDGRGEQFMLGITQQKGVYRFARNAMNESELSGVCFSPDGSTMFLNILNPGITLAITGPWKK
jgi:secreted PhoX family phosphatase